MGGRKDISKDGVNTQFGNGQDPTRGGRKKKLYTILKETGYSKDDIREAFGELAFYTESDIKDVLKNKDAPVIVKIVAKALEKATKDGDFKLVKDIIEQVIGKSTQPVEVPESTEFKVRIVG